jgi:hypothetical protein
MLDRYVGAADAVLAEVAATQGRALEDAAALDPALSPAAGPELARVERTQGHGTAVLAGQNLDGVTAVEGDAELLAPYLARVRGPR